MSINVAEIMGASPVSNTLAQDDRCKCEKSGTYVGASKEPSRDPRTFIKKQRADLESAEIRLNTMLQCLEDIYNVVNSTDHTGAPDVWADNYKDLCAVMTNCIATEKEIIMGA